MKHFLLSLFTTMFCLVLVFSCAAETKADAKTYTISYFANGATDGSVESQIAVENTSVAIKDGIGFIYKCHSFKEWNTSPDGDGKTYNPGDEYIAKGNLSLFAQWNDSHSLTHHEAKEATCTEDGYEAYDECSNCDYTTYKKIDRGHSLTITSSSEATCEADGYVDKKCTRCDYTEHTKLGDRLGHDIITISYQAPTCTEVGWNEYTRCTREGCTYKDGYVEIPATGHKYSTEWSVDSTSHWHKAICEHTTLKEDEGNHDWNDENICTVCGTRNAGNSGIEIDTAEYKVALSFPDDWNGSLNVVPNVKGTISAYTTPSSSDVKYAFFLDGTRLSVIGNELELGVGNGKVQLNSGTHMLIIMASIDSNTYQNFYKIKVSSSGCGTADTN